MSAEGGVRSAEFGVRGSVCEVRSAEFGVRSPECGVRSAEFGVRGSVCEVRSAEFGVRSPVSGVRSAECGVRSAESGSRVDIAFINHQFLFLQSSIINSPFINHQSSIINSPSWLRSLLLIALLAAFLPAMAAAGDLTDFLGRRVTRIDVVVEGAAVGDAAELRSLIDVAAGQDYSPVRIHDSLVRLYGSGLVSSARVEGEPAGSDGVVLKFFIKPQVHVEGVAFEGSTVFQAAELRARLSHLDLGQKLSTNIVARGQSELQAFYSTRGYYQAAVSSEFRLDPSGTRATIVYTIAAGARARVSTINYSVSGEKLDLTRIKKHTLAEGKPFSQPEMQDEIDRIAQAYIQQDYLAVKVSSSIKSDIASNTAAVAIVIDSGPKFKVDIRGLKVDARKKRLLPFHEQGGVDDFTLEEGRRRLLDYAQRQGYFFAEVEKPGAPDLTRQEARIEYVVSPGPLYQLKNIAINGVQAVPDVEIRSELKSKESSGLPFGVGRGLTSNELLRQDANTIQKKLREQGYRRAHVDVLRGVSVSGQSLFITFDVIQGPRTHIESIGLGGNNVFTADQLTAALTVKTGDPLLSGRITSNSDLLVSVYGNQGYATAEAAPEIVDQGSADGQDRVRLNYKINEGNRIRILHVATHGAAHTDAGRLKKDFYLFKESDWLRVEDQQRTERALYDTNAFTSVVIHSEPLGRVAGGVEERNVTVDIAEAKRYLLIYGFGYQSRSGTLTIPGFDFLHGARGQVQLTNTNMFGKLYTGSAQIRVAQDELLGQLSFNNPRPFGLKWPLLVSLFARRQADTSFRTDRYTALVQTERRLSDNSVLLFNYNFERISISDLQVSEDEIERNSRPVRLGRIGASYARDTRDSAFDATRGTFTAASASLASTLLGGNEQFFKMIAEHSRYYHVPKAPAVLYSVSGRLGLAHPFGDKDTLPISERFFGGGATDLRGYGYEQAGPRDPVTDKPVGGNALIVLKNELRFPVYGAIGGAVFSDTGNVFSKLSDFSLMDLTQTLGFGLRIKTPIGPLRFDLGFLVFSKTPGVTQSKFHISFGQTF